MTRWIIAITLLRLAFAANGWAQAGPDPHETGRRCSVCHAVHNGALTYLLKAREDGKEEFEVATSGVSGGSRSCLTCHATPTLRARLPLYAGEPPSVVNDGKYLGLDFSDDHPLAGVGAHLSRRSSDLRAIGVIRSPGERESAGAVAARLDNAPLPECTACHDVHNGHLLASEAERERTVCGACHEPSVYSLREHSALACSSCHDLHGGSGSALLADRSRDLLCLSCHSTASVSSTKLQSVAAPSTSPNAHDGKPIEAVGQCLSCHPAHHPSK